MEGVNSLVGQSESLKSDKRCRTQIRLHPANAHERTPFSQRVRVRVVVQLLLYLWRRNRRIWASTFRSAQQHIRLQYAKGPDVGDLGPAAQIDKDGNLAECMETALRIQYTEKLLSVFPWADAVDLEIFQMGFDAAQQWYGDSDMQSGDIHKPRMTWLPPCD